MRSCFEKACKTQTVFRGAASGSHGHKLAPLPCPLAIVRLSSLAGVTARPRKYQIHDVTSRLNTR